MSRVHYWQFLINKEGQPIPDANISVCLAGTDTPAYVYFDEFGSNSSNVTPQVITNNMGYFEFWIGDDSEEYGYQKGQKFKIEWEKPGVALGSIDWIDVFPHVIEVDETDQTSNAKNKVISNKLAFRWEDHRTSTLQDNGFPIHGIEALNETDTNTFSNKLISNFLGKKWNDHCDTLPISGGNPHGLLPVDIFSDDEIFDKLVNNKIIFDIDSNLISMQNEIDEISDQIEDVGNAGNIYLQHGLNDTWTLTHNFGVKYVSVTIFDTSDVEVRPISVELTNLNTCTVRFDTAIEGYAVITGNVVSGSNLPPFIIEGDHGSLTGLLSDDHTIYALIDGSRAFTGSISGITPTIDSHLTTKEYVDYEIDNIVLSHSRISNSAVGDDHVQYIHIDSRRGFRNPIHGKNPIDEAHLTTKQYVDSHIFSHDTLIDTDLDNHIQYLHIDGRRSFTHTVSGIIPTEPSHLATKQYVDSNSTGKYDENVSSWDVEGSNYSKTIQHNLSDPYPVVVLWNLTTKMIEVAETVESIDDNNIKIIVSTNNTLLIKIRT